MNGACTNQHRPGGPDESARLLHDEEHGGGIVVSSCEMAQTPLPKAQLGALVIARVVDPIAYMQIFPYINQLLADLRIAEPEQVGFYSGFVESAYALAQMFSVYQWGRLSDVVGRRPVVIFTVIGIAVTTLAFGWSTSLVTILASRFLGGLVAGNIAVMHSILAEITDETNQNMAVSIYSLSWSTGSIIGPLIGGTFSNAATRYPKYFSWPVFINHPYLPPCIISVVLTLFGAWLAYFLIEETLPSKRKGSVTPVPSISDVEPNSTETGYASMTALLTIPALRTLTLSSLAISFLASAFDVVFTLFCYTPVGTGGLGLQPSTIGNFLAFAGTFAVLLRLIAMPYILRRFDYATTFSTCMYLWPLTFACLPLLNWLALSRPPPLSDASAGTTMIDVSLWTGLALVLTVSKVAAIPFSITVLLIKRHAPVPYVHGHARLGYGTGYGAGPDVRSASTRGPVTKQGEGSVMGRSNGLVQFAMCLGRAVGPVVVSTLFTALTGSTWARRWGIGWMWSVVMVCLAMVGARLTKDIR